MGLVAGEGVVTFYNRKTGEKLFSTEVAMSTVTNTISKSKFGFTQKKAVITLESTNFIKDFFSLSSFAEYSLGKYHWATKEVYRLDNIRLKTKNKRIKNKLKKRILQLIMSESDRFTDVVWV